MAHTSYLVDLHVTLTHGLHRFGRAFRQLQAEHVLGQQAPCGGFGGRGGAPDLYYTGFGLRVMHVLGVTDSGAWQRAGRFLDAQQTWHSVVDALSLVEAVDLVCGVLPDPPFDRDRLVRRARDVLAACRQPSGGYGAEPGMGDSVYQTFLAVACLELLGEATQPIDLWLELWLDALTGCQGDDGAFADQADAPGGTNPTAAALVLLIRSGNGGVDVAHRAVHYLYARQAPDGGFGAHAGAPGSDLLSTFTALAALASADRLDGARLADAARFVRTLAARDGGFRACACDHGADVEYTYYGLGTLGLLGAHGRSTCDVGGEPR